MWTYIILNGLFGLIFVEPIRKDSGPYCISIYIYQANIDDHSGAGWCYIGPDYFWERIMFTYGTVLMIFADIAYIFLDMITLTVLYSILFCFIRSQTKNLLKMSPTTDDNSADEMRNWEINRENVHVNQVVDPSQIITTRSVTVITEDRVTLANRTLGERSNRQLNRVSVTLLIYPIIYIVLTFPLCLFRIAEFLGQNWGLPYVYFGACLFNLMGLVNVLLYTSTRRGIIPWKAFFHRKGLHNCQASTTRLSRAPPELPNLSTRLSTSSLAKLNSSMVPAGAKSKTSLDSRSDLHA